MRALQNVEDEFDVVMGMAVLPRIKFHLDWLFMRRKSARDALGE